MTTGRLHGVNTHDCGRKKCVVFRGVRQMGRRAAAGATLCRMVGMASSKVHQSRDLKKVSRSELGLCLEKERPVGSRGGCMQSPRRDLAQPVCVRNSREAGMERASVCG